MKAVDGLLSFIAAIMKPISMLMLVILMSQFGFWWKNAIDCSDMRNQSGMQYRISECFWNSQMEAEPYIPFHSLLPSVCFKSSHRAPSPESETAFHGVQSYLYLACLVLVAGGEKRYPRPVLT